MEYQARIVSEHKYQNVIREDPREAVGCSVQDYDTRITMKKNFSSLGLWEQRESGTASARELGI
jgi:hypothetical protein